MSQDNLIKIECTECHRVNYMSHKNKKMIKGRLELQKFCKWCGKHIKHKETK
ncbi:MAG: 50S ribosomal protein L33 [Patescibacteria group bacterium]